MYEQCFGCVAFKKGGAAAPFPAWRRGTLSKGGVFVIKGQPVSTSLSEKNCGGGLSAGHSTSIIHGRPSPWNSFKSRGRA